MTNTREERVHEHYQRLRANITASTLTDERKAVRLARLDEREAASMADGFDPAKDCDGPAEGRF